MATVRDPVLSLDHGVPPASRLLKYVKPRANGQASALDGVLAGNEHGARRPKVPDSVPPGLQAGAGDHFDAALAAQKGKDYARAVELYTEAILLEPSMTEAYVNRGVAHESLGNLGAAMADYNTALAIDAKSIDARTSAYINRANGYLKLWDYDQAIADCNKALELDPSNFTAYVNLGYVHFILDDHDQAIRSYDQALRYEPRDAYVFLNRGASHHAKGDYDSALSDYGKALELEPNYSHAYSVRSWTFLEQGDCSRAIADLTKALELDPSDLHSLTARGGIHLKEGDWDRAIRDFDEALAKGPEDANVYHDRGVAYEQKGDWFRGMLDFDRSIRIRPSKEAFFNRGVARLRMAEWDGAKSDLRRAKNMGMELAAVFRTSQGGIGSFEQSHHVSLPEDISDLVSADEVPEPGSTGASILELVKRVTESIPDEAYVDLPSDGSRNYKHYLYGWPKE